MSTSLYSAKFAGPRQMIAKTAVAAILLSIYSPAILADNTGNTGTGGTLTNIEKYAWAENTGWISLGGETGQTDYGVTVKDTYLTGYAWNEGLGWIYFGPDSAHPAAASQSSASYGINIAASGSRGCLSGYAWAENGGWLDFHNTDHLSDCGADPSTAYIDTDGKFKGYIWSEVFGWVSLEETDFGASSAYSSETPWRPIPIPQNASFTNDTTLRIEWGKAINTGTFNVANITLDTVNLAGAPVNFTNGNTVTEITIASLGDTAATSTDLDIAANTAFDAGTAAGNLESLNLTVTDAQVPTIVSREFSDTDNDGQTDNIKVTFSESISNASVQTTDFAIQNSSSAGLNIGGVSVSGSEVDLTITDAPADTSDILKIQLTGTVTDLNSNNAATEGSFVNATDRAAPVITAISIFDRDSNGDADTAKVTLSESILDAGFNSAHWTVADSTVETSLRTGAINAVEIDTTNDDTIYIGFTPNTSSLDKTATTGGLFDVTLTGASIYDNNSNAVIDVASGDITEVDTMGPVIKKVQLLDSNTDGTVETLQVTFTESLNDANIATDTANFTIPDGGTVSSLTTGVTSNDEIILVNFTATTTNDTSLTPHDYNLAIGSSTLTDLVGTNTIIDLVGGTLTTIDSASPVILSAETSDQDVNGQIDRITLTLSEPVAVNTYTNAGIALAGYIVGSATVEASDQTKVLISLTEIGSVDTGATPILTTNSSIEIEDGATNKVANYNTAVSDKTPPVVSQIFYNPALSRYDASFSESVDIATLDNLENDWTFTNTTAIFDGNSSYIIGANPLIQMNRGGSATAPTLNGTEYIGPVANEISDQNANFITTQFENGSGSIIFDNTAPYITAVTTNDNDSDGYLDQIIITYSENITMTSSNTGFTITGTFGNIYTVNNIVVDGSPTVILNLDNSKTGSPDTADTPTLRYDRGSDAILNAGASEGNNQQFTNVIDGADPVVMRSEAFATNDSAPDLLYVEFSEPVTTAGTYTLTSGGNNPVVQNSSLINSNQTAVLELGDNILQSDFFGTVTIIDQNGNTSTDTDLIPSATTHTVWTASDDSNADGLTELEAYSSGVLPLTVGKSNYADSDSDGVRDDFEITYFGNLTTVSSILDDSDNDSLADLWEMVYFGNLDQTPNGDADSDGVANLTEYLSGINPNIDNATLIDLDSDGLLDSWEYANGLDPAVTNDAYQDADADGLTNLEEYRNGTPAQDFNNGTDSDSDGLPDSWEYANFGDLDETASGDVDSDGIPNLIEYLNSTNPNIDNVTMTDSDSDSLPDDWEMAQFGNLGQTATGDPDFDGFTNFEEYHNGSPANPTTPDTDGDGIPDAWEIATWGDLSHDGTVDSDADGSTDLQEWQLIMNGVDTDGDGIPDNWERAYSLDLADPSDGLTDTDGDGVQNAEEYRNGGNPNSISADTDGDGMPDNWEIANGLDPASTIGNNGVNGDADGDGIPNLIEYLNGTDPQRADIDSDGDGLPDAWELAHGLDPYDNDTDGDGTLDGQEDNDNDGLNNIVEYQTGGDPNVYKGSETDSDGDGLPDNWELAHFGDLDETSNGDTDGDDIPNLIEYRNGTDPEAAQTDSDNDGMADSWELAQFGDLTHDSTADADNDGLTDLEEYENGTNPNQNDFTTQTNIDSDNDGLPDDWEYARFGSLAESYDGDSDADGLTNIQEFLKGTDPNTDSTLPDTDGDGMSDAWEMAQFGDLTHDGTADADGDGITDINEYRNDTDPTVSNNADTDGDGMSDIWEIQYGFNPYDSNDAESVPLTTITDRDQDGRSNLQEYLSSSDPRFPDSSGAVCAVSGNITDPNGGYTGTSNILTWTDPTDTNITFIEILRTTGSQSTSYTVLNSVSAGVQTYTDNTVAVDQTYRYSFRTINNCAATSTTYQPPVDITTTVVTAISEEETEVETEAGDSAVSMTLKLKTTEDREKGFIDKINGLFENLAAAVKKVGQTVAQASTRLVATTANIFADLTSPSGVTNNNDDNKDNVDEEQRSIEATTIRAENINSDDKLEIIAEQLSVKQEEIEILDEDWEIAKPTSEEEKKILDVMRTTERKVQKEYLQDITDLEKEIKTITGNLDQLEADQHYFEKKISKLQQKLENLTTEEQGLSDQLNQNIDEVETKNQERELKIVQANEEKSGIEAEIADLESKLEELNNKKKSFQETLTLLVDQITTAEDEVANSYDINGKLAAEKITELKNNISGLETEIAANNDNLAIIESQIEAINGGNIDIDEIQTNINELKTYLTQKQTEKEGREEEKAAAINKINEIKEKIANLENEQQSLQENRTELEKKIKDYKKTLTFSDQFELVKNVEEVLTESLDMHETELQQLLLQKDEIGESTSLEDILNDYVNASIAAIDDQISNLKLQAQALLENDYEFSEILPNTSINKLGRKWQEQKSRWDELAFSWDEAVEYCAGQGYRLPTGDELKQALEQKQLNLPESWSYNNWHKQKTIFYNASVWVSDEVENSSYSSPDINDGIYSNYSKSSGNTSYGEEYHNSSYLVYQTTSSDNYQSRTNIQVSTYPTMTTTSDYGNSSDHGQRRGHQSTQEPNKLSVVCVRGGDFDIDQGLNDATAASLADLLETAREIINTINENEVIKPQNWPALQHRVNLLTTIIESIHDGLDNIPETIDESYAGNWTYVPLSLGTISYDDKYAQIINNFHNNSGQLQQEIAKNQNLSKLEESLTQAREKLKIVVDNGFRILSVLATTEVEISPAIENRLEELQTSYNLYSPAATGATFSFNTDHPTGGENQLLDLLGLDKVSAADSRLYTYGPAYSENIDSVYGSEEIVVTNYNKSNIYGPAYLNNNLGNTNNSLTTYGPNLDDSLYEEMNLPNLLDPQFITNELQKIREYQNLVSELESQLQAESDFVTQIAAMNKTVKDKTKLINNIDKERGTLADEIAMTEEKISAAEEELQGYENTIADITNLQKKKDKLLAQIKSYQNQISTAEEETAVLNTQIEESNANLTYLRSAYDQNEADLATIENELKVTTTSLASLTNKLEQVDILISELSQEQINTADQTKLAEKYQKIIAKKAAQKEILSEYQSEMEAIKEQIVPLKEKIGPQKELLDEKITSQREEIEGKLVSVVQKEIDKFVAAHLAEYQLQEQLRGVAATEGVEIKSAWDLASDDNEVGALIKEMTNAEDVFGGHKIIASIDFYTVDPDDLSNSYCESGTGTAAVTIENVATDIYGVVKLDDYKEFQTIAPGNYDIVIRAPKTAPKKICNFEIQTGENDVTSGFLTFGDMSGDGKIDKEDFEYATDPKHWEETDENGDLMMDMNEDGEVDLLDLQHMYENWEE